MQERKGKGKLEKKRMRGDGDDNEGSRKGRERKKTKATSPISPYQMAARNLGREIGMTHHSTIGLWGYLWPIKSPGPPLNFFFLF